jgi:thiol:disulfide interchange protein DsbD
MKLGRILFVLFSFCSTCLFSQILEPVHWNFEKNQISENQYELVFIADIDPNWAIYSQSVDEGGPIPTTFFLSESSNYKLIGEVVEDSINMVTQNDPIFDMVVSKFYNQAIFRQKVEIINYDNPVSGSFEFMTCDDTQCLAPEIIDFKFNFSNNVLENDIKETIAINQENLQTNILNLYGFLPSDINKTEVKCIDSGSNSSLVSSPSKTLYSIFGLGFIGGLLALLTPCVFPMIPLTVSFFTKKNKEENSYTNAILYGVFIVLVYLILSIPFHLLDSVNPDILNDISTNIYLNISFFVIFLVFAFSFFGYYELTLPSSWLDSSSKSESIGGVIGIFFMALTLAIVSFSCTGPILGSLLAGSISGDSGAWELTAGMGGFGLALGLPFALFAMFPNMLESLPKSGGWLNTIKVSLGFIELALALKFLSNADLVAHWGIIKIEAFLVLWLIIFLLLAIYLFGKIQFPHEIKPNKISFDRKVFALLSLGFAIYLASGLIYNKETQSYRALSLLSGLAPPLGYSYFLPKECPNNLNCFKDFKSGIEYAKKVDKPVLLDFTGYACVNCRKMEEHVWPLKSIDNVIRENYVLISLYVDDKKLLPEDQQILVERNSGKGARQLINYGHKWAYFQAKYFKTNSQPYYVLYDPESNTILNHPVGYTPNEDEYLAYLNCGLEMYRKN